MRDAVEKFDFVPNPPQLEEAATVANYLARNSSNLSSAREIYIFLLELDPSNVKYHLSLSSIYKQLNQRKLAISEAKEALSLAPQEYKEEIEKFLQSL